jgi:hypothetical protein
MANEWYVSFHGGDEKESFNNIHVYSSEGHELRKALNSHDLPGDVKLRELRGFAFGPDGNLYVVNAYYEYSEILKFRGTLNKDKQHDFVEVFVKQDPIFNPGISHPFNAVFDRIGNLYVSSQDTNVVTRYYGPRSEEGKPGSPMPVTAELRGSSAIPPGTFVPSAKQSPNGLMGVRDAIFDSDGVLYIADRDADCIRKYDGRSGKYLGTVVSRNDHVDKPIHLLFTRDVRYLLIGSGGTDSILEHSLIDGSTTTFITRNSGGLSAPAGMAFGDDGFFYVASRESRQILRFTANDGAPDNKPFVDNLTDHPEFLMLVER